MDFAEGSRSMSHADIPPRHRALARTMRKALSEAELKFWNAVRAHRLMGLGFRRQMPIAGCIVDFACPTHRLIVEIDGTRHAARSARARDAVRTARLEADDWTVVRFWNHDVLTDIDGVCAHILAVINEKEPGCFSGGGGG
jgi:very-short-patch-repair endonuclease